MKDVHLVDSEADKVPKETLFRAEALEQYARGRTDEGHLLELEPAWTRRAYFVIVALLAAALLFCALVYVVLGGAAGVRG
jgi:hypothetical protein